MTFTTTANSLEEFLKLPETKPVCQSIDGKILENISQKGNIVHYN